MHNKKNRPKGRQEIIAEIKNQLKRTQDPVDRELLKQRLHHWLQLGKSEQ